SLDEISPLMRQAQIDIEDERFYDHGAMDLKGTFRAFLSNIVGGATQGGSSITQQYVKQVRVENAIANDDVEAAAAAQEQSYERKIEEMRYAIAIEKRYSKDEILLRYLNIVFYGDGAYGVEAAAMHYFGVHAKDLNLAQSAMLAGIVQNPNLNPADAPEEAIEKRNAVLDAMLRLGHIEQFIDDGTIVLPGCENTTTPEGQAACETAKAGKTTAELAEDLIVQTKALGFDPAGMRQAQGGCVGVRYSTVCHFIEETLYQDESFGETYDERKRNVKRGGYEVYTTIRPEFQDAADASVAAFALATDPIIVTINEVQPGTGEIWAMAQNRPYGVNEEAGETSYVFAAAQKYGGSQGFQAGSTFKTFTSAAAIDQGFPLAYRINSPNSLELGNRRFTDCEGHANSIPVSGGWRVTGGGNGAITMYQAAANSVNTYYAQLILQTGPCAAARMAKAAGVELANGSDIVSGDPVRVATLRAEAEAAEMAGDEELAAAKLVEAEGYTGFADKPSFTLGVADVTPLSMAGAFATYGARGKACTPSIIKEVKNRDGATFKNYNLGTDNCVVDAVRPEVMDGLNDILKGVTNNGLGAPVRLGDRDQGTKTGTTEYNNNVWTVTYTPEISVSVSVSVDPDPKTNWFWDRNNNGKRENWEMNMSGVKLPSGRVLQGWSYLDPPIIFNAALRPLRNLIPTTAFTKPTAEIVRGTPTTTPNTQGAPDEVKARLENAGYSVVQSTVFNAAAAGTYLSTSCDPYRGGICTMLYSKGPRPDDKEATPAPTTTAPR
ncbi:MAG: penicillin-binding protein, partial [Propionibacteriaceae bacterium]|nr:penicillin-binding protein [Propionibacteriaceae bacterium]